MSSLTTTLLSSVLRYMVTPSNLEQMPMFGKISNNVTKSMGLLLIISALGITTILLSYFGITYYLYAQGYSLLQLLGLVLVINFLLIGLCIILLKSNIDKINAITATPQLENVSPGRYHIVSSFLEGFNSK